MRSYDQLTMGGKSFADGTAGAEGIGGDARKKGKRGRGGEKWYAREEKHKNDDYISNMATHGPSLDLAGVALANVEFSVRGGYVFSGN